MPPGRPCAHRRSDGIGIRLHNTDVVVWHPDETVTLNTGGWLTVTTKGRINDWAAPFGITSVRGEWKVMVRNPDRGQDGPYWLPVGTFHDGMVLDGANPTATLAEPPEVTAARAADDQTKRAVRDYVKGITEEQIARSVAAAGGDCWTCRFGIGDEREHLVAHLEESYYVAHLMRNALAEVGYKIPDPTFMGADTTRRAVKRYMLSRLLIGPSPGRRANAALSTGF